MQPRSGYDLILSHAGEDSAYVTAVGGVLTDRAVSHFCSEFSVVEAWGRSLTEFLAQRVAAADRFFVLFASAAYAAKTWTTYEMRLAQQLALSGREHFVLPVRLDDTEIPGLPDDVVYLDARTLTPGALAERLCEKLGTPIERNVRAYRWFAPIKLGQDSLRLFQNLPVAGATPDLEHTASRCLDRLLATAHDAGDGTRLWTHREDREFDRLHATSSVLYALRQAQLPSDLPEITGGEAYLRGYPVDDIDHRAAAIYRLVTGDLDRSEVAAFVDLLADCQSGGESGDLAGAFLFPQGPSAVPPSNRLPPPHVGGGAFHACHLADALLHLVGPAGGAHRTALPVLDGLRDFLERTVRRQDGWLRAVDGSLSPLTSYAYALFPRLSLPLPRDWRAKAREAFEIATAEGKDPLTAFLAPVNLAYIHITTGDATVRDDMLPLVVEFVLRQTDRDLTTLSDVDVAMLLRAVLSCAQLAEPRLLAHLCARLVAHNAHAKHWQGENP